MKIGILAPYSRPWDKVEAEGSGMNVFIRESTEALACAGHQVTVFIRRSRETDKNRVSIEKNIELITISAGEARRLDRTETYSACQKEDFPFELIQDFDALIVHYWISEAWVSQIASRYHSKILFFSHSYSLNPYRPKPTNQEHLLAEIRMMQMVTWCANSTEEFDGLCKIMSKDRVELIRPGANHTPMTDAKEVGIILFVGRKNQAKGYDLFYRLAQDFPKVFFKAIGRSGQKFSYLKNLVELDFVPLEELMSEIKQSNLVICPSRYEHFGLVPLLANHCGVPVVVSKRGGFFDVVVENKTGWFFDGTYEGLKQSFERFLNLDKFVYPIDLQEKVKQTFSWSRFIDDVVAVIMKPEVLCKGKVMQVTRTPVYFNNTLIPYEQVQFKDSVHVIPITDDNKVVLIKEARFNDQGHSRIKVISGILEEDEDPEVAAQRELEEETGLKAGKLERLVELRDSNAIIDTRHYFIARDLSEGERCCEPSEKIQGTIELDPQELFDRLINGEFDTTAAGIAIHILCLQFRREGKLHEGG